MSERKRAYLEGELVTILDGQIGGKGKTKIRTPFGFEKEVSANKLKPIPKGEPEGSFSFASPDD